MPRTLGAGMRRFIEQFIKKTDQLCEAMGRALCWLGLLMMVVMVAVVVLRYGFDLGWIAMQECVLYLHATFFMLGMAYTLKHDGHVRVDVFYRRLSNRKKAWVDLVGTLCLLTPVCVFITWVSFDYVSAAWSLRESSPEAGGLPWVYLLKTLLLLMGATLWIQGLSQGLKALCVILGWVSSESQGG